MIKILVALFAITQSLLGENCGHLLDRQHRLLINKYLGDACWRNSPNPFELELQNGVAWVR